jgi:hypothetical protein
LVDGLCGLSFWCTNRYLKIFGLPKQIDRYLSYPPYHL